MKKNIRRVRIFLVGHTRHTDPVRVRKPTRRVGHGSDIRITSDVHFKEKLYLRKNVEKFASDYNARFFLKK